MVGGVVRQRLSWRELLKRTFELEVLRCPRCTHSPMLVLGVVPSGMAGDWLKQGVESSSPKASGRVSGRPFRSRSPPSASGQLSFGFAIG